jgi:uncharacterized protein YajQ (UPF0234 family)
MTNKYDFYSYFDQPIPYKSLLLYPVRMKDVFVFNYYSQILLVDKENMSGDIEMLMKMISMTELEYIYAKADTENSYFPMLYGLLQLVLKDENLPTTMFGADNNGHAMFTVNNVTYDSMDYAEIKKIICEVNDIELPDKNMERALWNKLKEVERFRSKSSGNSIGNIEEQMICLAISTNYKLEDIYDLTIHKFNKMLRRVDHKLHYEIYKSASMSGFVEFTNKSALQHWMADLDKSILESGVTMDKDEFTEKVQKSGGK